MVNFMDPFFEGLEIRPVTRRLVECIFWDLPLPPPVIVDFCVDTANHYRALKEVLFIEAEADDTEGEDGVFSEELRKRILALEDALGSGPKLNTLIKRFAPQYADRVHFQTSPTSWDDL